MKHPEGPGRVWQKDISYTTPGPRVKDYGVKKSKEKSSGAVFPETPDNPRPVKREC